MCIANKIDVDLKVTQKEFGFPKKHNLQVCVRRRGTRASRRMPFARMRFACLSHAASQLLHAAVLLSGALAYERQATQRSLAASSRRVCAVWQFFFCSASDGTNVVAAFQAAIGHAVEYSQKPAEDFVDQVLLLYPTLQSRDTCFAPSRNPPRVTPHYGGRHVIIPLPVENVSSR